MDVGIFNRGRFIFWCWLLAPILLIGAIQGAVFLYGRSTAETLAHRRTSLQVIPELRDKAAAADGLLKHFAFDSRGATPTVEALSSWINDCTQRHGVSLNLLVFQPPKVEPGDTVPAVKVEMECEGALVPLLSWLDEMRRPENLLVLDGAVVRLTQSSPTVVYGVKLLFRFYAFPAVDPPGRDVP